MSSYNITPYADETAFSQHAAALSIQLESLEYIIPSKAAQDAFVSFVQ